MLATLPPSARARAHLARLSLVALVLFAGCAVPNYAFDGAARPDGGLSRDSSFDGDAPHVPCTVAMCGDRCVDISNDLENCGDCGVACPNEPNTVSRCQFGRCLRACAPNFGDCDGDFANGCETDLQRAPLHCGRCGTVCPTPPGATASCEMSRCAITCLGGFGDCDGTTANGCETNLNSSTRHCGSCGAACGASMVCARGACEGSCPIGTVDCGTGCADIGADPTNCGMCGTRCEPANANGTCVLGACTFMVCNAGFENCDRNPANGCEHSTQTDPMNCGRCGEVCPTGPNSEAVCAGGRCGLRCAEGFGNCDSDALNGCESDLRTDPNHCFSCRGACPSRPGATATCSVAMSGCGFTCNTGLLDCDGDPLNGCELNGRFDSANCGACGRRCPSGQACNGGTCGTP